MNYPGSLHNHTDYSNIRLRDCIIKTENLINYAGELGHKVVAITDHECISNHIKVEKIVKKIKDKYPDLKIIRGNEIYLCRNGLNADNYNRETDRYYHFILLAKDAIGHQQIREISTRAWHRSYMARGMRRVPTYYQDLFDIIGENPGHVIGSTACFKAGTQVETMHGWKNIEEIQSGDFIINRFGEWEEVLEPTSMFTHQYGYEFEITGSARPIVCTDNHEFLVITNNSKKPKWVQAKDLNLTPRSNSKHIGLEPVNRNFYSQKPIIYKREWDDSYLKKSQFSHRRIELPEEIQVTPELMRLFGLFLGDGCISLKENPRISFTFNEKEYDNYMTSFINKASKQLGITWSINKRLENHRVDISSSSADLINLFYYLFGDVKADTKKVPFRLRISKELDYELIFGYFLADGYFRTRTNAGKATNYACGEFTSASISKQLSYDIYQILNELNITSSISHSKGRIDKNNINHKDTWYVSGSNKILGVIDKTKFYSSEDVIKLFEEAIKIKEKDFITIDGIQYRKIRFKKATKIEINETVYCLNNITHSFKCENLIVHNCLGGALPTQLLRYKDTQNAELGRKIGIWVDQMDNLFGHGNFYLELQPSENKEQIYVNKQLLEISGITGIPYIITTDSHYLKKEDRMIHKAFLNSQDGDREVDDFYATTYMMSTEELESYFKGYEKEVLETAYQNILKISEMCEDYSLLKPLKIPELKWNGALKFPEEEEELKEKIPKLNDFINSEHRSDRQLAYAIIDGIHFHPDLQNQRAYDEINSNLEMTWVSSEVNKARWSAYYLNLQRIIDVCWEAGSLVGPGRGSGVGFILLYVLGITQINPLRETTPTYAWRFLNPNRVSVLDVDFDIEGGRRSTVLTKFREVYGEDRVSNVATFGTEKSKSAILTAARGLGIDVDVASYISSLIPADRGLTRTLDQCMYGDEESGFDPIRQFVIEMTENYPELWKVARKIEGLVNRLGQHAGGVIFVDEPFTNSTALMRAPDDTIITAFDLHDCEDVSLIKYDALSVEAMDKIHICLDLLCDAGLIKQKPTLKQTYEEVLGIYNLERDDPKMWEMVWRHEIFSLFQMEKQSGIQGIALSKPSSVDDLATLNSVIRLMAQEKGAEQPLNKFARFKANINNWYDEMYAYGLTTAEQKILEPHLLPSNGICESQEGFMQLVQIPECGGFDLTWADRLRKSIAKKNPAEYEQLTKEYFEKVEEKGLSPKLCNYVWNVLVATSRGYGFNKSHTLAYSLIALQEMNLAFRFPIIFWNCACLISDSGGAEIVEEEEDEPQISCEEEKYYNEMEEFGEEDSEEDIENSYEEEDCDGYPTEVVVLKNGKKKKKVKTTNYGKIATAIGKMRMAGIEIAPPDINKSTYTFSPDLEHNTIRYGMSGISKIGEDLVKAIIVNRPYQTIEDLTSKVKITKPQVINLIKSGAFDFLGDRVEVMRQYVVSISDQKKRVTLQNMKMLIDFGLLPDELSFECKVFNFNKYLKKFKDDIYYDLDENSFPFYEENFDMDLLSCSEHSFRIKQTSWDNIYQKNMDKVRPYVKAHHDELLKAINERLMKDTWDKYCLGSLSKWEMDAVSFYSHQHELENVKEARYEFSDFYKLPEEPEVERIILIKGKKVPLFKIHRIMGTVLDKDKAKKTVTLLTKNGVVTVKIFGQVFSHYDKQLSERGTDGKKHVIEKSMFSRGNKLIVTGIRREDSFIAKKYAKTPYHLIELITSVDDNGEIETYYRENL